MASDKNKKLADKEISETLFDDFDRFEHFFVENWKKIIYGGIGIIVVVAVIAVANSLMASAEDSAANAIASAKTPEEIQAEIDKHPGSKAVAAARMKLAAVFTDKKEYNKAIEVYTKLVGSDAPDELRWRARLNIAYIYELQGKDDEAAAAFSAISSDGLIPASISYEAGYSAGRLYIKKKDLDRARAVLKNINSATAQTRSASFWAEQAKTLLDRIGGGAVPESEKVNNG